MSLNNLRATLDNIFMQSLCALPQKTEKRKRPGGNNSQACFLEKNETQNPHSHQAHVITQRHLQHVEIFPRNWNPQQFTPTPPPHSPLDSWKPLNQSRQRDGFEAFLSLPSSWLAPSQPIHLSLLQTLDISDFGAVKHGARLVERSWQMTEPQTSNCRT